MINQNFCSSIYQAQVKNTLEMINTSVDESLKNPENTSLSKLKIFAAFIIFKTKTTGIKALASSIGANIIYNDLSQIIKLAGKIRNYNAGMNEINNLQNFSTIASAQLRSLNDVENATLGKIDEDIGKVKRIVVDGKDYFRNITSSASKELVFRIIKIASVALIGFGAFSVSKPIIITGGIVYLVSRLLISRNQLNLAGNGRALRDKIIIMNTLIDVKEAEKFPKSFIPRPYGNPYNYQQLPEQLVHPHQVFPYQQYGHNQPQFMQNAAELKPVYWSPNNTNNFR